jgi:uncharacterized RDD family membrane protein YckC
MYCHKCGAQNDDQAAFCDKCGAALQKPDLPASTSMPPWMIGVRYAGFWKRFAAALIDGVLLTVAYFVAAFTLGVAYSAVTGGGEDEMSDAAANTLAYVAWVVTAILGWLYYALMEGSSKQATLGKMALGIVVTDAQGRRVSFTKATGRYFGKIISGIILYVGFIMIAFTEKKQGLHDIMADCLVVMKNRCYPTM